MKLTVILAIYIMLPLLSSCKGEPVLKFEVLVNNDEGDPVSHCYVWAQTFSKWQSGQGFGRDVYVEHTKQTGVDGISYFELASPRGDIQFKALPPDGYYPNFKDTYEFKETKNGRWVVNPVRFKTTLMRIKNPAPMFAKNLTTEGAGPLGIPAKERSCAYDFEVGDWIAPDGIGKTGDIVFHCSFQKDFSGDSKRIIQISFPGKKDGLSAFDRDPWHGSELRSDYEAPAQGYKNEVTLVRTIIASKVTDDAKPDRNYYFRVRTKLDENGNIISANFGKIYGDFMSFIYYFNPRPNDRSVEFDPKRNLFKNQTPSHMVLTP
jgi:hypothetical protein